MLATGPPLSDPRAIDIEPDGDLVVADGQSAGGSVIHVDRETGVKSILASGGAFRVPAGLGVVGGAGVDQSGGGNGDADGPAAPPTSHRARPGHAGRARHAGRAGTPGARLSGHSRRRRVTVTLPDGRTVTLPPGVTAGTSGIRGVDFAAPAFLRKPKLSRTASAPPAAAAASSRPSASARRSSGCSTSPRASPSACRSSATSAASAAARRGAAATAPARAAASG